MSDDYTPEIDKGLDVESEDPVFEGKGSQVFEGKGRKDTSPKHNGRVTSRVYEELGETVACGIDGSRLTPPPADARRAIKTEAARDATNARAEWVLGAWSGGGLLYRTLADLLGTGVLEFSEYSLRTIAKKYGVDSSNLSKVCKQWEAHFGVEIGHCRHGEKKAPDPLSKLKKSKKKHFCRDCYADFWQSSQVKRDDVTCPKCLKPAYRCNLFCEDCKFEFQAVPSKPVCPKCNQKVRVPIAQSEENPDALDAGNELEQNELQEYAE